MQDTDDKVYFSKHHGPVVERRIPDPEVKGSNRRWDSLNSGSSHQAWWIQVVSTCTTINRNKLTLISCSSNLSINMYLFLPTCITYHPFILYLLYNNSYLCKCSLHVHSHVFHEQCRLYRFLTVLFMPTWNVNYICRYDHSCVRTIHEYIFNIKE